MWSECWLHYFIHLLIYFIRYGGWPPKNRFTELEINICSSLLLLLCLDKDARVLQKIIFLNMITFCLNWRLLSSALVTPYQSVYLLIHTLYHIYYWDRARICPQFHIFVYEFINNEIKNAAHAHILKIRNPLSACSATRMFDIAIFSTLKWIIKCKMWEHFISIYWNY